MNKTTIIFLRHGEVHNKKQILYARLPGFKLSKNGIVQIQDATRQLISEDISHIYTSPMLRARQTASIISRRLKIKPQTSKFLNEVKLLFSGMLLSEYKKNIQPRLYDDEFIKKGQERVGEISHRMLKFVDMICKKHPSQTILAVSHGDPITILRAKISHKDFTWNYKKDNYLQTGHWLKLKCMDQTYRWT